MTLALRIRATAILGVGIVLAAGPGCKPSAETAGTPAERIVQVVVAKAKIQEVQETLPLVGSVVANEQVEIKSEIDGKVQAIHFEEGQPVEAGQLLVELDESKLTASVAEAEANSILSAANYKRAQTLIKDKLISQQEFEQIFATYQANAASLAHQQRQLKDTRIYAPFSGVMGSRMISPGQVISRNTTLTWLVDLDPVKVEIQVPERFLGQLRLNQKIAITVAAFPGQTFLGDVFFIAPFVDPDLRTALVKARVPNRDKILFPGMFANINLTLKIRDRSVVIPEEALNKLLDDGFATLYIKDEAGTAQMIKIKIGQRLPGLVEVLQGLKGGEDVIVQGLQKLAPGVKVRAASPPSSATNKINSPT